MAHCLPTFQHYDSDTLMNMGPIFTKKDMIVIYMCFPLAILCQPCLRVNHLFRAARHAAHGSYNKRKRKRPRRSLSNIAERPRPRTLLNQQRSGFLAVLPIELRQMMCVAYFGRPFFVENEVSALLEPRYYKPAKAKQMDVRGQLALLLTCRQMWAHSNSSVFSNRQALTASSYAESINYLYSTKTFRFDSPGCFDFQRDFLPRRLQCITTIYIRLRYYEIFDQKKGRRQVYTRHKWEALWSSITDLPRLNKIEVRIDSYSPPSLPSLGEGRHDGPMGNSILEPLFAVTQANDFQVWLEWKLSDLDRLAQAPFRVNWRHSNDRWYTIKRVRSST